MNKKTTISIEYLLYFLIVFLITYQDSPLGKYMGSFGYSFIPITSLILFLFYMCRDKGKLKISVFERKLYNLLGLLSVVTIIAGIIWTVNYGINQLLLGQNVAIKSIKGLITYFSYISFVYVIRRITKNFSYIEFLKPIYIVLIVTTIICIIEAVYPNSLSFLHFTGLESYSRIRLLTKESSWTTMIIYIYAILSLYYSLYICKKKVSLFVSVLCCIILLYFTSSKTLMATIFISIAVFLILNRKNMTKKKLSMSIFILVFGIVTYCIMQSKIFYSIENSLQWSSIPTRIYTLSIGLIIGFHYPLGVGTALYLKVFPEYLRRYFYVIKPYDTGYALREIKEYMNPISDDAVTVKSGLLQNNMYWGIVGTILFVKCLWKYNYKPLRSSKVTGKILLQTALIVSVILLFFAVGFTFEFWLLVSFTIFCTKKEIENEKKITKFN